MNHLRIFLCLLALCTGCTTAGDRAQWEEAMKDLRGENMEMGSRTSAVNRMNDQAFRAELRD